MSSQSSGVRSRPLLVMSFNWPKAGSPATRHSPAMDMAAKRVFLMLDSLYERSRHRQPSVGAPERIGRSRQNRTEDHTSELQSIMRMSYFVVCWKKIYQLFISWHT